MKRLLFINRFSLALVAVMAFAAAPSGVAAGVTAYSQDFETLVPTDPNALGNDGWLVYGNVYEMDETWVYGYGPFPAPNNFAPPPAAFCAIVTGEGGAEQGANQVSVYNDYENLDHPTRLIEANVYREWLIDAADIGTAWVFQFDAKRGDLTGSSTAHGFIKTIDPGNNFAATNFLVEEMTFIPATWGTYFVGIRLDDPLLEGQIFQIGFLNVATAYEPSAIFYDNLFLYQDSSVDTPGLANADGHALHAASPNPFRGSAEIRFAVPGREAVTIDVFDVLGRRVARLLDGTVPAGQHRVVWSGQDSAGRAVASGTYYYRMETTGYSETRSVVKLR